MKRDYLPNFESNEIVDNELSSGFHLFPFSLAANDLKLTTILLSLYHE
jgi:hypothetical protein